LFFVIILQKLLAFGGWDGYRCSDSYINEKKPWFQVKKCYRMLKGDLGFQVTVGCDKYWIVRLAGKTAFRIVNIEGDIVAEVSSFLNL
jgi:hypothetical protein